MGIGDMLGKAAGALGGGDDIMGKISEMGIDPAELAGMDVDSIKSMLADKGSRSVHAGRHGPVRRGHHCQDQGRLNLPPPQRQRAPVGRPFCLLRLCQNM